MEYFRELREAMGHTQSEWGLALKIKNRQQVYCLERPCAGVNIKTLTGIWNLAGRPVDFMFRLQQELEKYENEKRWTAKKDTRIR